MAQLKVKQISDFVTAVAAQPVGTATATAIGVNSSAIAANVTDIATNAGAIATNVTDIATNAGAIATNATAISVNAGKIATNVTNIATNTSEISRVDGRVTTLLGGSTEALDTFGEIKTFIDGLAAEDVTTIAAISTAVSNDVVHASGISANATAISNLDTAASTALSNAISTEVLDRDAAILVLDNDLQAQITALSGVNSDEVIATFVDVRSFDAGKVFNLNGGHVAVFVNGLQIHEAAEGIDGWRSVDGKVFTVEGLGYDLEGDDHIIVSGTLA